MGRMPSLSPSFGQEGMLSIITMMVSYTYLQDTPFKILFVGMLIEFARAMSVWVMDRITFRPTIRATFKPTDPYFEYLMCFLIDKQLWRRKRDFIVVSKTSHLQWAVKESEMITFSSPWYLSIFNKIPKPKEQPFNIGLAYEQDQMAEFVPKWADANSTSQLIRWQNCWIDISQSTFANAGRPGRHPMLAQPNLGDLQLTFFTMDPSILPRFAKELRENYKKTTEVTKRVIIHQPYTSGDRYNGGGTWTSVKNKPLRPLNTVSLEPGVLEDLVRDIQEFLTAERWYTQVGIPHRRGILLHGPPGTGKTSTIYGLAGELGLEIYSVSLSGASMDDHCLESLVASVPKRTILLMEDIDCAFPSREEEEDTSQRFIPNTNILSGTHKTNVTMSGLLNVLDGVGSDEGRLFFATTNYPERLDAALMRPGRIDRSVEYHRASTHQIRAMYHHFFPLAQYEPAEPLLCEEKSSVVGHFTPHGHEPVALKESLTALGDTFSETIPSREFTTAEIQGYLLLHKWSPAQATSNVAEWLVSFRDEQRRLEEAREARAKKVVRSTRERSMNKVVTAGSPGEKVTEIIGPCPSQ